MPFSSKINKRRSSSTVLLGTLMSSVAFSAAPQNVSCAVLKDSAGVVVKSLINKSVKAEVSTGGVVDFCKNNWKWLALVGTTVFLALLTVYFLLIRNGKQQVSTAGEILSSGLEKVPVKNLKGKQQVPAVGKSSLKGPDKQFRGAPFNSRGYNLMGETPGGPG